MSKYRWFEVHGLVDEDDDESGTETKESFDTLEEAQYFLEAHKEYEWSIDEWENDGEGGQGERIRKIC